MKIHITSNGIETSVKDERGNDVSHCVAFELSQKVHEPVKAILTVLLTHVDITSIAELHAIYDGKIYKLVELP